MNELLQKLYSSQWDGISNMLQSFNEEEPKDYENLSTHPLLIKTNKEYENADLKIMFFGQETFFWGGENNDGIFEEGIEMDSLFNLYDTFYLQRGYEQYGKPFWNFVRNLRRNSPKNSDYIWNNVLKIGKCSSGTPQQGLINYTFEYFNVIPQEIDILEPDVLLFLSGHGYDGYIKRGIGDFSIVPIEGFSINELCELKFESIPGKLALRTYHPGYLQRLGTERMNGISEKILQIISKQ